MLSNILLSMFKTIVLFTIFSIRILLHDTRTALVHIGATKSSTFVGNSQIVVVLTMLQIFDVLRRVQYEFMQWCLESSPTVLRLYGGCVRFDANTMQRTDGRGPVQYENRSSKVCVQYENTEKLGFCNSILHLIATYKYTVQ